jgi:hypothetical protein
MCCVMPPASPETTSVCRIASSSSVLPWSTWPMTVITGARGLRASRVLRGLDAELELLLGHEVDLDAEVGADDLDGVVGQRLLHRGHLAHLEQLLDQRRAWHAELVGELADRDAGEHLDPADRDLLLDRDVPTPRLALQLLLLRRGLLALLLLAPVLPLLGHPARPRTTGAATGTTHHRDRRRGHHGWGLPVRGSRRTTTGATLCRRAHRRAPADRRDRAGRRGHPAAAGAPGWGCGRAGACAAVAGWSACRCPPGAGLPSWRRTGVGPSPVTVGGAGRWEAGAAAPRRA